MNVETVLEGLNSPAGVAIRPGGTAEQYEMFVSDGSTGRVVKVRSNGHGESSDVITGFGQERPAGLLFLDRDHLVVACEQAAADACLRLYELTDGKPLSAEQTKQAVALGPDAGESHVNVYALARTLANDRVPDLLIVRAYGASGQPALWKIPLRAGTLADAALFADEKQSVSPASLAVSDHGYVIAAWVDEVEEQRTSRLAFYNPINGSTTVELAVDLEQIVALAYSPRTGNLYAANSDPANDAARSGVYRIDDASQAGKPAVRAVKIGDVPQPTALAFAPDGALYAASGGQADRGEEDQGLLVKIIGEL